MDVILERCAGLDVHQATVTACLRLPGHDRKRTQVVQTCSENSGYCPK